VRSWRDASFTLTPEASERANAKSSTVSMPRHYHRPQARPRDDTSLGNCFGHGPDHVIRADASAVRLVPPGLSARRPNRKFSLLPLCATSRRHCHWGSSAYQRCPPFRGRVTVSHSHLIPSSLITRRSGPRRKAARRYGGGSATRLGLIRRFASAGRAISASARASGAPMQ
jgi:hypothetical protein